MEEVDSAEHRPKLEVIEDEEIPVIDLSIISSPDAISYPEALTGLVKEVMNHGVPLEVREKMENASREFFGQPAEEKRKVRRGGEQAMGEEEAQSEQEEKQKILTDKFSERTLTLPKRGLWYQHLLHFHGFWLASRGLNGVIFVQDDTFWHKPDADMIILASFPKCGTTWLKALIFAVVNRTSFDPASSSHPLLTSNPHDLVQYLEIFNPKHESIPLLETMPSPRIFSTHIPYSLFPSPVLSSGSDRFVYICRDPKDVFVSTWHFVESFRPEEVPPFSLQEAFQLFCDGVSLYGPFWDHVLEYWRASLEAPEKVLFLKYEDMKRAPLVHVKRLAEFLGKPFSSQEAHEGVVEEIVRLCSFQNLSNLEVNKNNGKLRYLGNLLKNAHFFRKGEVGDWENHLTPDMAARLDQITKEKLQPFGLSFSDFDLK